MGPHRTSRQDRAPRVDALGAFVVRGGDLPMSKHTYKLSIVLEAIGPIVDHTYRPPLVHKLASILSSHRTLERSKRTVSDADIQTALDRFLAIPQLAGKVIYVMVKAQGRDPIPFSIETDNET